MDKPGRNDPCPCGSGKKFKKCCQNKMIGKKFMATKIDTSNVPKTSGPFLTSFFQQHVTPAKEKSKEEKSDKDISEERKEDPPSEDPNLS